MTTNSALANNDYVLMREGKRDGLGGLDSELDMEPEDSSFAG